MRWGLTAVLVAIAATALGALTASAQQNPDPPICNTNLREWGRLAGGSDAAAMRDLLARTPNACRELRGQINARIVALSAPRPRVDTPTSTPADPCTAARTQWQSIETTGTIDQVQAFLEETPALCSIERSAAQRRVAALDLIDRQQRWAEHVRTVAAASASLSSGGSIDSRTFRDIQVDGTLCDFCPEMIALPGGTFMSGAPEDFLRGDRFDQTRVELAPFAIGRYEITFDQWLACAADGGCSSNPHPVDKGWGRGSRPVINVSYDDAQEYLAWLSRRTGNTYRLPSRHEWEYAARGGTNTAFWWGNFVSGEHENTSQIGFRGRSSPRDNWENTAPVGALSANPFGLFDVMGNVQEWIACENSCAYAGGAYYLPAYSHLNFGNTSGGGRSSRLSFVGFRVVRELQSPRAQEVAAQRLVPPTAERLIEFGANNPGPPPASDPESCRADEQRWESMRSTVTTQSSREFANSIISRCSRLYGAVRRVHDELLVRDWEERGRPLEAQARAFGLEGRWRLRPDECNVTITIRDGRVIWETPYDREDIYFLSSVTRDTVVVYQPFAPYTQYYLFAGGRLHKRLYRDNPDSGESASRC
jgi:formylglycine-generating enzyme required for sulfatase activity